MEKLAKKTAEDKKEALDNLEKAEELLDDSKELGADVEGAEELIDEAREHFEEKELEKTIEKVEKGLEIIREANSKRVTDLMKGTEELHEMIAEEDRYKESLELLDQAKEAMEDDDFKGAMEKAKESLDLALLEIQEKLTDEFATLDSMVISLEDKGEDPEEIETKVQEARDAMEQDDFQTAVSLVNECKELLHKDLKALVEEEINKVKKQEEMIREGGGTTVDIEEMISKARNRIKDGHFESAVEFVDDAKNELNEAMEAVVEKVEGDIEGSLNEAKEIECDISKIDEMRERLVDLKYEGKYSEAYEHIQKIIDKLEELKFQRVLKTIAESRDHFIKGKEIGIDISEPMGLLNKARTSLKEGDHKGALDWANAGRQKVRELVEEHERIEMRIAEAKRVKQDLVDIGIELTEATSIISASEEALGKKDYGAAEEKLEEFDGYIDKNAYEEIMKLVEDLEVKLNIAEDMDLDVAEYTESLEVAIANTKSAEYAKAGKITLDTLEELNDLIEEALDKRIKNMRELVQKTQQEMTEEEDLEELEKVEGLVEEVESAFDESDYRKAHDCLKNVSSEIKRWRVGEAEERYTRVKELVGLVKELEIENIDEDAYEERLEKVTEAFDDDDYTNVVKLSDEMLDSLNKEFESTAEEVFSRAKMEAVKAKKAGVDIEDLRSRLIDCKKLIRNQDFTLAIRNSLKVEEDAKRMTKKRKSSYDLISSLSTTLTKLRKKGEIEDITPAKELLLKAKTSFQDKDYTQAENLALQAKEKIGELTAKSEFESKLRKLRENLEEANALGIDTTDIELDLDEVTSIMKEGDIEEAVEGIREAQENIKEKMSDFVKPEIERTRDIINSANNIGVDVSTPEAILEEVESLWEAGDFSKALTEIEECKREIEGIKNKSKRAASGVKRVKDRISKAKDLNADVKEPEKYMNQAIKALKEDRYEDSIKFTKKAEESVEEAEMVRVYSILETFNKKIAEVRKEGVNTAFADNLMKRAEKAMDAGKYHEAINLAMQSEGEVERIELQKDIAKRSISTTQKKIEDAKEEGIKVGDAKKLLDQAKQAYKGGFYVKAFDNAVKSGDDVNHVLKAHQEVSERLESLPKLIDAMDGLEVGEKELQKRFEDIKRSMSRGRYTKALETIKENEKSLEEVKERLHDKIDEIEKTVNNYQDQGKEVGSASELLQNAKGNVDMGELIEACNQIQSAKKEFGGDAVEGYQKYIGEAKELIQMAKKFGASITDAQGLIKEATSLEGEDISGARDKAHEALECIEKSLEPYSPNISLSSKAKLQKGDWNTIKVEFKNTGRGVAKSPELSVSGGELKKVDLPAMLKADEELELEIKLKPIDEVVTLTALGTRIFDQKELTDEEEIEVVEKLYGFVEAEGGEHCNICGGTIKEGLEIIRCSCGETIHKPCGEREGKCPNCGVELKEKKKKKASKRVALKI